MDEQQPTIQTPPPEHLPQPQQPVKKNKTGLIILIVILILVIGGGAAYYFLVYSQEDTNQNSNERVNAENVNTAKNINKIMDPWCLSWRAPTDSNIDKNSNFRGIINPGYFYNQETSECEFFPGSSAGPIGPDPPFDTMNECEQLCEQDITTNANLTNNMNSQNVNTNQSDLLKEDTDEDGIPDVIESWYGTEINKADSDKDGYNDYEEIAACYNPLGTGRINGDIFENYCQNFVVGVGLDTEKFCSEWAPIAEKVINARVAGTTESEIYIEIDVDSEYMDLCEKASDQPGDIDNQNFCLGVLKLSYGMCDISEFMLPEYVIKKE